MGMGGPGQVGFDAAGFYKNEREALGRMMMIMMMMFIVK
jgi:hypothetical protein